METTDKNYPHYITNILLLKPCAFEDCEDNYEDDYDDHYFPWQLNPIELLEAPDFDDYKPTAEDLADFEEEYWEHEELDEDEINQLLDGIEL